MFLTQNLVNVDPLTTYLPDQNHELNANGTATVCKEHLFLIVDVI